MTVEQLRELLAEFPSYYHVKVQVTVDDGWNHWDAESYAEHVEVGLSLQDPTAVVIR
jgi:hypothetical protein